jgi:hypothetical protein
MPDADLAQTRLFHVVDGRSAAPKGGAIPRAEYRELADSPISNCEKPREFIELVMGFPSP